MATYRETVMCEQGEDLTRTYNRFHSPESTPTDVENLRCLHEQMDHEVLIAYRWDDLSRRKKPWRVRWPDEFRDEVLARLLELNEQLAAEERRSGAAAEKNAAMKGTPKKGIKKKSAAKPTPLLDQEGS